MRVRHFNIAGVAWSNFKPGIDINGRTAILNDSLSIDVANVGAGVDKALVELQEGEGGGGGSGARRLIAEVEGWAALTTCLPGAA